LPFPFRGRAGQPKNAATTTRTGTDDTVDSKIDFHA
jgi:hypothetical protein